MPNSQISMVVTSCNRHELLQQMLTSFYHTTDIEPQEVIIIEDSDSPMPEFLTSFIWKQRNVRWFSNNGRKGQIYSIDRAYRMVNYPYIFHAEEDWLFTTGSGWMARSKDILDTHPNVIQVSLRGDTGWHPLESCSYEYKIAKPYWHGCWGGLSFNPGLRRTSTFRSLGSLGRHVGYGSHGLGHEKQLSLMFLDKGYRIADLNEPIVTHTGGACSRAIEPLPPMPKVLVAIPACFKLSYSRWESDDSPAYNSVTAWQNRGYGTGIHLSGVNDRIDAVRSTWAQDLSPFPSVDLKFFYGLPPEGYPRAPLPDEVFLSVPDDYAHLPHKVIAIADYAIQHGYDYLFKCDDDTFVWIDRLIHELLTYTPTYAGWDNCGVASGGCGYWLSRKAFSLVAASGSPDHWAEDQWVGKVMGRNNIKLVSLSTHLPGMSDHWFDLSKVPSDAVAIHAVKPDSMRELYRKERGK